MNWNKIKEKYPKAHKLLIVWMSDDYCDIDFEFVNDSWKGALLEPYTWEDRRLYDFFDSNEIIITIKYYLGWGYQINNHSNEAGWTQMYEIVKNEYKTRIGAEQMAFKKAFELLEIK